MKAPAICPARVNSIRMNFPNRDELLFRTVCAFPKASKIGLALRICWDKLENWRAPNRARGDSEVATAARYWMTFFVFSVFPAPDSPLYRYQQDNRSGGSITHVTNMLWFSPSSTRFRKAPSAIAKICGLVSSRLRPRYILMYSLVYIGSGQ